MGRLIVVGSLNVDLVVHVPRLPGPGATVIGGDLARHQGGKGGNQAVAAARMGTAVSFVGAVGDDELGHSAVAALAAEGVQTGAIARVGRPTGAALIVVDHAGQNQIAVAPGASEAVDAGMVTRALAALQPAAGDVVLVSCEIAADGVRAALAAGRAGGAVTLLNPAPADGLHRATLELADVITPNEAELAVLAGLPTIAGRPPIAAGQVPPAGSPELDQAARAVLRGDAPRWLVVTLGAAGAVLYHARSARQAVEAPAVAAVDTTGAGDTFNGVLAAQLAAGLPMDDAVRRAVIAASMSTRHAGARAGSPSAAQLGEFIARGGG